MTRRLELALTALSLVLTALSAALISFWVGFLIAVALGAGWIFAIYRRSEIYTSVCFCGMAGLIALLALNGVQPLLDFFAFVLALAAWDLSRFSIRLDQMDPTPARARVEKLHLTRLGLALGAGTVIGLAAILIRLQLTFTPIFFLVLFVIAALVIAARQLTKPDNSNLNH
jgi:hypothetical protein